MAGGGGSADAQTSLNMAAASEAGLAPRRWGRREWVRFVLAVLPVVIVIAVVAIAVSL